MAYSDFEKAEAFKDTLEVTFQENEEPYCDDKIEEVENLVDDYFDNFATCTPPLTSPSEINHKQLFSGNGGVIDPPCQLSLFDDNIQWVPVVKYLGLHIDSRLTFKKHIDYLSEKFWGRISLAISLVGRRSPLSLENKVILYKQILRPVITYGSPVWGAAAATHMKKIQVMQNKILRVMTNAPWVVRNASGVKPELIGGRSGDMFSDESRFCLGASDDCLLVRRMPGECLEPNRLHPRHTPGLDLTFF
ncbi:RNA-directed DNA polymerase from mobile element jockey [Trichonephila clavipes]|uniref:RNA-directed DNA polymerase from mobile element jockey n=1 Tax=Trichonephila clavipes TaxID=2585209 RepID=A0A8X6V9F4_TRICX|nr:RNA-directed DNA polymerase from mobile element jockey [Trichonephila clavipes]